MAAGNRLFVAVRWGREWGSHTSCRAVPGLALPAALRRVSELAAGPGDRGRRPVALSRVRSETDRGRPAAGGGRRQEVTRVHAVRARMDISKSLLSGMRRRPGAPDGVLFRGRNSACPRGCLRHLPLLFEKRRSHQDGTGRSRSRRAGDLVAGPVGAGKGIREAANEHAGNLASPQYFAGCNFPYWKLSWEAHVLSSSGRSGTRRNFHG